MRMRTGKAVVALVVCALSALGKAPAADFASMAPEDAFAFIGVGHLGQFIEKWQETAYGKLWRDPEMAAFTRPGRQKAEEALKTLSAEWAIDCPTLKRLFPGQVALWAEYLAPYKPHEWGLVLVAERAEPPEQYRPLIDGALKKWIPFETKNTQESAGGETVYAARWDTGESLTAEQREEMGPSGQYTKHSALWAFPEGLFILAFDGDESIQRLLARVQQGESCLAKHEGFRPMAESFTGPQFRLFLNIASLAHYFRDDIFSLYSDAPKVDLETLGVSDLLDASYRVDLGEEALSIWGKVRVAENPRGIARMLSAFCPLDQSLLKASPAKPHALSITGYDLSAGLSALINALRQGIPAAGAGWALAEGQVKNSTGLSLADEIIPAFGKQLLVFTAASSGQGAAPVPTFVVELANSETVGRLIDALMAKPGASTAVEKTEFLGATIYALAAPMPSAPEAAGVSPPRPTLALTPRHLIFSLDGDLLRETIRRISGKNPDNFLESGAFGPPAPPEGRQLAGYSYQDTNLQAEYLLDALSQMQTALALLAKPQGFRLDEYLDLSSKPQPETLKRYLGVTEGWSYVGSDGVSAAQSLPNEPVKPR